MWRKKEIIKMQVQQELAEQDDMVFVPKETVEAMKTRAFLEMHEKLLKLEEEVKILTEIIRAYDANKVS